NFILKISGIILIFGLFCFGQANASQQPPGGLRYRNYLIKYELSNEKVALKIHQLLELNNSKYEEFYHTKIRIPVKIIIAANPVKFNIYSGRRLPQWAGAAYLKPQNVILLKSYSQGNLRFQLEHDFLHELSHLFFDQKFKGKNIPLWYNEGLAEYLSGREINLPAAIKLSNALLARSFLSFAMMDSLLYLPRNKAELAYIQSLAAVLYLQQWLGNNNEWERFHEAVARDGWEIALKNLTGMDEIDFELSYYHYIRKKYRWLFLLNLENLIWVGLILVLGLSMYWIRYRNKKILQEWGDEEQSQNYDIFYFPPDNPDDFE
ncbi:MAG: peptidase MA family metallohydrolase, partial [Calditrichia bacterium]